MSHAAPHNLWHVKGLDLFAELSPEDARQLEQAGRLRTLASGEALYMPGDEATSVYAVRSGLVRLAVTSPEGREGTLALLERGELFGELELMEGETREHFAVAHQECVVLVIPRNAFLELIRTRGDFAMKVTLTMGQRVRRFHTKVSCLLFKDARARFASLLLELGQSCGEAVAEGTRLRYRFSHREMAGLIGVARETVSYTMLEFRERGLITVRSRYITLLDGERLTALAQG